MVAFFLFIFLKLLQNANGGFATYELTRSYHWLEVANISAAFYFNLIVTFNYHWLEVSMSSNLTSSLCSKVEGEVMASSPTGCMCNLAIKE